MILRLLHLFLLLFCLAVGAVLALLYSGTQGHLTRLGWGLPAVYGGQITPESRLKQGEITDLRLWPDAPLARLRWRQGRLGPQGGVFKIQISGAGLQLAGTMHMPLSGSPVLQKLQGEITSAALRGWPPDVSGLLRVQDLTLRFSDLSTLQLVGIAGIAQLQDLHLAGTALGVFDLRFDPAAPAGTWALQGDLNPPPLRGALTGYGPLNGGAAFLDLQLDAPETELPPELAQYLDQQLTRGPAGWRWGLNPELARP